MKPSRILLASMPPMLMEMIAAQIRANAPEFVTVGAIAECSDLASAIRHFQADLLIVAKSSLAEADASGVLSSSYPAKILAISEDCQDATLYSLTHREKFVDVSIGLIDAMRTAIGRECKPLQ